jgi:3-phenylpropionate/cinnamic acid dioxygenase small subunit
MEDKLGELSAKDEVIGMVNRLFVYTDNRDWERVKECFSEEVHFDMTSMAGGEPTTLTPDDIVAAWDDGLKHLESIHHQAGNYLVDVRQREATVFCYGTAMHYLTSETGDNTRTFVGSYDFHLAKIAGEWRIDRFRFNLKFIDGNPDLEGD